MENAPSRGPSPSGIRVAHAAALAARRLLKGAPRITLEELGGDVASVRLEGVFMAGFVGSLAAGLAAQGVSVVRGFAEANAFGEWEAELVVARVAPRAWPSLADFVRFADRDVRDYSAARVELSNGSASRVPDHGGSLLVIVEGQDQIGFLASVLNRLAQVALYPVEIAVSTTAGRAADRFWLRAPGHREPRADALHAVSLALHPVLGRTG
ncbi:MAG TPA: hypothetical protein VH062_07395 [Polyangiaceae bacterium]|jgi:hypothetical protein|nr:hypothetical protein [Polyangiaceae bacterium]